jgi:hypothetical protein
MVAMTLVLLLIFSTGHVRMADYYTQVASALTLSILGLGFWTLKPQLSKWFNADDESNTAVKLVNTVVSEPPAIGQPVRVDEIKRIWYYDRRDQIKFPEFMKLAKKKIRMSAITFSILTLTHEDLLCELASSKIKLTFLILDPNSKEAQQQISLYKSSDDLINQINDSLKRLCKLQQQYPNRVSIKTYKELLGNSVIILDDSIIKIEKHEVNSGPNSRSNTIFFKHRAGRDFRNHFNSYLQSEKTATKHTCQSA